MKTAEFVVKVASPYFTLLDSAWSLSNDFLESAIEFAVKNKVFPLFYEGCEKLKIRLPREADVLMSKYEQRRRKQLEAIKLLLDICEKYDLELLFFKTFKPFNYIPDDIDVLLRDRNDISLLCKLLKEEGYNVDKIGTPEITMRWIGNGTLVDIDIHTLIAAGYLPLFKTESLWRNSTYKAVGDGYKIRTLSERHEVIREAAYSLLKDFTVSIAGLYLSINAIMGENLDAIRRIAEEENLLLPLDLFLNITSSLAYELFGSEAKLQLHYERKNAFMIPLKLVRADLRRWPKVPYPYPFSVVALAYLSKIWSEIHRDKNLEALLQLIKQPSSKGMHILLDYVRNRLSLLKHEIKM